MSGGDDEVAEALERYAEAETAFNEARLAYQAALKRRLSLNPKGEQQQCSQ